MKERIQATYKTLEEYQKASHNEAVQHLIQLQRLKLSLTTKEDQVMKLSSELDYCKNRIDSLEMVRTTCRVVDDV